MTDDKNGNGNGQKGSALNPKNNKALPSFVEDILSKIEREMPEKETFLARPPTEVDHAVNAFTDRQRILQAAIALEPRVPVEKLKRFIDVLSNEGWSMSRIKELAGLKPTVEYLNAIQELMDEVSPGTTAQKDDILAITTVARAIMKHTATSHPQEVQALTGPVKTPFQAWQVRDALANLITKLPPKVVEPEGFDNEKVVKQFQANFNVAEIVLWNKDIWIDGTRGYNEFKGTPLDDVILSKVIPMFWQYDVPFKMQGPAAPFVMDSQKYDCIGFCIMPTMEELEGEVPGSPMRLARHGVAISLIFVSSDENADPEVRFLKPIYEGDFIKNDLDCLIMAGVKFLAEDFVQKESVQVSKKELKADRQLFKQVRKGKVQVPPIKVINLRRVKHVAKKVSDPSKPKREYSCWWLVDPHWRRQWYPGTGVYKPKYISTYPKGDLTKPFKPHREKVYKAVR